MIINLKWDKYIKYVHTYIYLLPIKYRTFINKNYLHSAGNTNSKFYNNKILKSKELHSIHFAIKFIAFIFEKY